MATGFLLRVGTVAAALALISAWPSSPAAAAPGGCRGLHVRPGQHIQWAIEKAGSGGRLCLEPGVHKLRAPLAPRSGQTFIGEPGTILKGRKLRRSDGFTNSGTGVTIRGLEISSFKVGIRTGRAWKISHSNIHGNSREGVRLVHEAVFEHNHVHHNQLGGVQGYGKDIVVVGNEINNNQIETWRCSSKFVETRRLVLRNNYVHHNRCPALWVDINSYRPLIEGNRVVHNKAPGIDCEISFGCVIRHNIVKNNNKGILALSSPNVAIYGNKVAGNGESAIVVTQQGTAAGIRRDHRSGRGKHVTKNNHVYRNSIRVGHGFLGVTTNGKVGAKVWSRRARNRFEHNDYRRGSWDDQFRWRGASRSWREWRSFGNDNSGTMRLRI